MSFSTPNFLRRLGRQLLWNSPTLYRPFGIARGRGDCLETGYDLWIDGYPRSANTFAVKSFLAVNPTAKIRSHQHIAAFMIQSLRDRKPGMMMMRKPEDAVLSWAIFWQDRITDALDYYVDFHRAMLPHAPNLFIAQFEEVTSQFDAVIGRFNKRFGTDYTAITHNPQTLSDCFAEMDRNQVEWRGFVDEMRVPRPSTDRVALKREIRQKLRESPSWSAKLKAANEIYCAVLAANSSWQRKPLGAATQEIPTCS